jgi:hypothetical protein
MTRVKEGITFSLKLTKAQPVVLLHAVEGQIDWQQHFTHKLARTVLQQHVPTTSAPLETEKR